ncbi:MAG: hypothetical protein NTY23_01805 [Chloroflexi bacterium]|nr:hypothetical protein [Chloroflexota bacterium]
MPRTYKGRPAIDIPYGHHEKWDGTGYPQGLKGEQIPLAARLFSVVDVWDAPRADRPYRAAWSAERALTYLRSESGRQFDPHVVEDFLQLIAGEQSVAQQTWPVGASAAKGDTDSTAAQSRRPLRGENRTALRPGGGGVLSAWAGSAARGKVLAYQRFKIPQSSGWDGLAGADDG